MSESAQPLRIIFAGTPDFAASNLQALLKAGHQVIGVYTQPDRPAGRGRKLTPSPVKKVALENNISVYQPLNFKEQSDRQTLNDLNADLMIVVAYGLLLPKAVLEAPRLGCINVHASLLPRWRGAAPIHRSLLAGDTETGVTIMQMDEGLDTGAMLLKKSCAISPTETSGELHDKLAVIGAEALLESLPAIADQSIEHIQQDNSLACYAHKLEKAEGEINWNLPAEQIVRQIRGLSPWPVSFTCLNDATLRVWQAETTDQACSEATPGKIIATDKKAIYVAGSDKAVKLLKIQLPGSKAMDTSAVLNAKRELFADGTQLG
ncbi:methionyl-tRNA formyltransferase [Amphritea balenae]|uniref:Methionyl-tRNA formyltransferase n=1 Tax=Amphritea balenae TaxID=452629 RepID=A0A3P1SP70_9GAMM|nr:methionyl-tRNA formyltransferase [Amphritea balenae]RRC98860.1 methionyl-tRNA formyltransferase [Amphritea balenae]GGK62371.1 methionyl-tRNA formyltransferase [Amphritea balenae]